MNYFCNFSFVIYYTKNSVEIIVEFAVVALVACVAPHVVDALVVDAIVVDALVAALVAVVSFALSP